MRVRKSFGSTTLLKPEQLNFDLLCVLVFSHKISFGKRNYFLRKKERKKVNRED